MNFTTFTMKDIADQWMSRHADHGVKDVKTIRDERWVVCPCGVRIRAVRPLTDIIEPVDTIVGAVRADLLARSRHGVKKYGVTLDRTDVDLRGWLQHAYEEVLDLANYLKRAIVDLDEKNTGTLPDGETPDAGMSGRPAKGKRAVGLHARIRRQRRGTHDASKRIVKKEKK